MCACNRDGGEEGGNGERGIEKKRQRVRYNNIPYLKVGNMESRNMKGDIVS